MEIFKRQYDKLNAKLKSELTTAGAAPSQNLVTLEIKADRSSCAAPIFYSTYRHPYYAYFTYHPLKTEHTALL